jgi:hypothetical protein
MAAWLSYPQENVSLSWRTWVWGTAFSASIPRGHTHLESWNNPLFSPTGRASVESLGKAGKILRTRESPGPAPHFTEEEIKSGREEAQEAPQDVDCRAVSSVSGLLHTREQVVPTFYCQEHPSQPRASELAPQGHGGQNNNLSCWGFIVFIILSLQSFHTTLPLEPPVAPDTGKEGDAPARKLRLEREGDPPSRTHTEEGRSTG